MSDCSERTVTSSPVPPKKCHCSLCQKKDVFQAEDPKMKTTKLCIIILKSLKEMHPDVEFFSLKNDINVFIKNHWALLSNLPLFKTNHYRKALLDAFNHCQMIESGKNTIHNRGFYKLSEGKREKVTKPKLRQKKVQPAHLPQQSADVGEDLILHISQLKTQIEYSNHLLTRVNTQFVGSFRSGVTVSTAIQVNNWHLITLGNIPRVQCQQ
ncbi:hypothetical protein EIN_086870 [Entamoeba invadens IP1]|uniref:hypothetical protein n=1 Tax=Entamoeba invadens IP1 TaxID=370355 RepID=UPI0002C3E8E8|nr:hypothetical protein EIN_086870 [Entamoeba invadens IP1]ELP85405.1 hypothetical protein EIN_086870 [Entamoeba invadens IP1]|eukprot:XP_004184751.1 hypothetical protein EIN_086870 [Entamoeba invadens IP1]